MPHFRWETSKKYPEIPFPIKNSDKISLVENLLKYLIILGEFAKSQYTRNCIKYWFFIKFSLELAVLCLEISANYFLWEFIYEWKNNILLDMFDLPTKLIVTSVSEIIAIFILGLSVLLQLLLAVKNGGFKE